MDGIQVWKTAKKKHYCSLTITLLHSQAVVFTVLYRVHSRVSCSQPCIVSNPQWNWIVMCYCDYLYSETWLHKEFLNHLFHSEYCGGKLYSRQWSKCEVTVKRKVVKGGRGVEEVEMEVIHCWYVQVKVVYVTLEVSTRF